MLNRKIIAALLAAAITLCGVSVFAADPVQGEASEQPEAAAAVPVEAPEEEPAAAPAEDTYAPETTAEAPQEAAAAEQEAPAEVTPDPVGSVSFANLGSRVRENNFNMLALTETIASIQAVDYDKMKDDLKDSLKLLANTSYYLSVTGNSFAANSVQQQYDSLKNTWDDLKDGKIQEDYDAAVRQLENAQDQIVMAAESLYIALVELEQNDRSLDRQLNALDRTIQELELRYDLGQISTLTLQQAKAGRTSLVSGRQTLNMNLSNYKTQLELMIGAELSGKIKLQALPQVSAQELAAMNLEKDLAAAKANSYDLFAAKRTLDDAKETYSDTGKEYGYNENLYQYASAKHTWEAAQYTYSASIQNFENSFRVLYNQVKDYQQVLAAAKTALEVEKSNYAVDQLKYEQGTISKNDLLTAEDDLNTAQDKVTGAAIDLFAAYHNYRWAVDRGILN
ncbi:TolC family protein [Pseudoflavonifractor phocaeensis]|uniref:TolC family protein n=1 Tax=Pseudoflavonifractor phocaeensis TaxID=1870988 RepID=UPI001F15A0AC|nr:TolC family protein [Pseudoflavonifractor phocaeensis]MCF2661929.1 TolC family protein [Pseudoflavonifractor phocaeensis]